jgi:hypothetical protein
VRHVREIYSTLTAMRLRATMNEQIEFLGRGADGRHLCKQLSE